eukprot:g1509.t1
MMRSFAKRLLGDDVFSATRRRRRAICGVSRNMRCLFNGHFRNNDSSSSFSVGNNKNIKHDNNNNNNNNNNGIRSRDTRRFMSTTTNMDPIGASGVGSSKQFTRPKTLKKTKSIDSRTDISEDLVETTNLTSESLERLRDMFLQASEGEASLDSTKFARLFPTVEAISQDWYDRLFLSFDVNQNGRIDFRELAEGMGALYRNSKKQMRVASSVRSGDSDQVRLMWPERPRRVLLIKKWRDPEVTQMARDAGLWLQRRGVEVVVEQRVRADDLPEFETIGADEISGNLAADVDFVLCLGGDGTLLHLSSLLTGNGANAVPPVVSFGLGSLGFLTPFEFSDVERCLEQIMRSHERTEENGSTPRGGEENEKASREVDPRDKMSVPYINNNGPDRYVYCSIRTRLHCAVYAPPYTSGGTHTVGSSASFVRSDTESPDEVRCVLNECLIDRGSSSHLTKLDLYVDGQFVTTVQADGLIVATPSGSTAYSLAAGGSMIAPTVQCMLVTPVAPHSLSFRPLVLDSASTIDVYVSETARDSARVSFDGRSTIELERGMRVRIRRSETPIPLVNMQPGDQEWFDGIKQKLNFNLRADQKPFVA